LLTSPDAILAWKHNISQPELSQGRCREGPGAAVSWRWLAGTLHSDRMRRHSAGVWWRGKEAY